MELIELLGERSRPAQLQGHRLSVQEQDGFLLETYELQLNGLEAVPAYLARPLEVSERLPVVLYQHSHGGDFSVGKQELLTGAPYLQQPGVAKILTSMGYGVWAIDAWGFEERGGIQESELVKEFLLTGRTLWGMRLFDVMSLLDYLETRSDMDTQRIATLGMSMGGLLSWWLAALDSRIKVCVDLAAQVDLETLLANRRLDQHGFYYYVPHLLRHFSTGEIQARIAPRPRLSIVGNHDLLCPAAGVAKLNGYLQTVYQQQGAATAFSGFQVTGGHMETAAMRFKWQAFLKEHL